MSGRKARYVPRVLMWGEPYADVAKTPLTKSDDIFRMVKESIRDFAAINARLRKDKYMSFADIVSDAQARADYRWLRRRRANLELSLIHI